MAEGGCARGFSVDDNRVKVNSDGHFILIDLWGRRGIYQAGIDIQQYVSGHLGVGYSHGACPWNGVAGVNWSF